MERKSTEERRRQIAQAALKIIAEQGLGKFTTSAIAQEVGLSDGALFRHFKSKNEIVMAAIEILEDELFQQLPASREDPLEELGEVIQRRLDFLSQNPHLFRLFFSEQLAQASGEMGMTRIRGMRTRTLEFIRGSLKRAKKAGLLREDLSVDELTVVVFGSVFGAAGGEFYRGVFPESTVKKMHKRIWATLERLIRG